MCGIAALFDPEATARASVPRAVASALRHRGPDGDGIAICGPTTLVHTRLAIIDLEGGEQPMRSEDRACAVAVNGEVYNHLALRGELERAGHRFASHSDSEVVLHGYEQHGPGVVERLNGMFTFVLWDNARRRLVAARDPFGIKPLYWWTDGRRVAVASEVSALLATGWMRPAVDPVALEHFLAWRFVPSPRTLFAGISKVAPASMLIASQDGVKLSSYRRPPGASLTEASSDELEERLSVELRAAVERQMMSDVPYGAFLSGGVDSAAVAAAMTAASGAGVDTFTIGFPGHGEELDERVAAAASAREIGTHHHATAMDDHDFSHELGRCIARLEEPCGTASAPALMALSRFTAQHVKVTLSGQGADEPLGGYERHQAGAALGMLRPIPGALGGPLQSVAQALPRNERAKRAARLLNAPPGLDRILSIFEITSSQLRTSLVRVGAPDASAERRIAAEAVVSDVADRGNLEQVLYLDTHLFLPDGLLVYGDKMSMAFGLEQRVPFLDIELMRFVERIPARLRVNRLRRKWLYRRAMRGLVPKAALGRPKHPFATPYDDWLRASLGAEVERAYARREGPGELIDATQVARLISEHRRGTADHKRILYCLLELSHWHRHFIEG